MYIDKIGAMWYPVFNEDILKWKFSCLPLRFTLLTFLTIDRAGTHCGNNKFYISTSQSVSFSTDFRVLLIACKRIHSGVTFSMLGFFTQA